jgi:hypothetical protein
MMSHAATLIAAPVDVLMGGGAGAVLANAPEPARRVLPFGSTLHYQGCGCPANWTPGTRAADLVDSLVQKCTGLYAGRLLTPSRRLRVAYMLPHHNITGRNATSG